MLTRTYQHFFTSCSGQSRTVLCLETAPLNSLQTQTVVDQTISFLRTLAEIENDFQRYSEARWQVLFMMFSNACRRQNFDLNRQANCSVAQVSIASKCTQDRAGRPSFQISTRNARGPQRFWFFLAKNS